MAKEPEEPPIDWDRGEDVVIPPQRAVRVYTNARDDIVIAQESYERDDDFPFVVIRPENVRAVIAALTRIAGLGPEET
jgi:hypothetical protein